MSAPAASPSILRGKDGAAGPPRPAVHGPVHPSMRLFENSPPFQMVLRQLQTVAGHIDLDGGVFERLSMPKRALVVSVPIRMDDGRTERFIGFRVQRSLTSGPAK